ncbi:MAG: SulP family inorganic anion transporter [Lautropia sp.]|nr:SulP family inorganic anion transporter [Lautropia sp.]
MVEKHAAQEQSLKALFRSNFAAGLVVFLVALPLCLGIALASGAPPMSGIISGVVGGVIVGALSTSHISVSGPAAGLAAIILAAISQLGSFELFLCAVLIAGVIQLALGFLRAGSIAEYIPVSVIEGMLAGIGVIIVLKQLPYALGMDEISGNGSEGITAAVEAVLGSVHTGSLVVTLVSMAILIGWDRVPALKNIRMLPAALVAVMAGIVLNEIFIATGSSLAMSGKQLVQLPVPKGLDEFAGLITFPDLSGFSNGLVWTTGITLAVVGSIETLLSIEAADRLDVRRRITDTNQELRAQGVGNFVCSLLGGMPVTSVVVRSSANAGAGATHKLATIIHGGLLLVCVLSIPFVLNRIPLATLAAVLILVGYKLAKPSTIMHFWEKGHQQFIPFAATMAAVVMLDLLKGVGIGLAISVFFILQGNMKRAYYLSREELSHADEITIELAEEVSFLNKAAIKKTLKNIQPGSKVTIDASRTSYIASDVLELIEDFANVFAREFDIQVTLKGFKADYEERGADQHSHVRVAHGASI